MGMYTELIFGASLKQDTPIRVINTLKFMIGELDEIPNDFCFGIEASILCGSSYYFGVHEPCNRLWYDDIVKAWSLSSRSNTTNRENQIEKFLEWIKPYIESGSGFNEFYAITIYEEDSEPTIHYLYNEEI